MYRFTTTTFFALLVAFATGQERLRVKTDASLLKDDKLRARRAYGQERAAVLEELERRELASDKEGEEEDEWFFGVDEPKAGDNHYPDNFFNDEENSPKGATPGDDSDGGATAGGDNDNDGGAPVPHGNLEFPENFVDSTKITHELPDGEGVLGGEGEGL